MKHSADYEIWLTTRDGDGSMVPYELVGGASSKGLALALLNATRESGYSAEIIERTRAI